MVYRAGQLAGAEEMVALDAHLAGCAACRTALGPPVDGPAKAMVAASLTPGAEQSACLEDELLARYVRGEADAADVELVETHAAECRLCAGELESVRALHGELRPEDWAAARAAARGPSVWVRMRELWGNAGVWRTALPLAGGAAAGALAAWIAFTGTARPPDRELARLRSHAAEMARDNRALREEVARFAPLQARLAQLERDREQREASGHTPQPGPTAPVPATGDRLVASPGEQQPVAPARPRLALRDGPRQVTLDSRGKVAGLPALPPSLQEGVRVALDRQQLRTPGGLASLIRRPGRLLGPGRSDQPFTLRAPVGTFVLSERPAFRWAALKSATTFRVTVVDDAAQEDVATSETIPAGEGAAELEWQLPETGPGLRRGRTYRWYVVATLADGSEAQSPDRTGVAKFRVLEAGPLEVVEHGRTAAGGSHLALGVLYAQYGLLEEAEREFTALFAENPGAPAARRLLERVRRLGEGR